MANDSVGGFRVPVLDWVRDYQSEWIKPDVLAGLTAAAVVTPKAIAYATIAGLAVQVGLYTAFLPMLVYALSAPPARSASARPRRSRSRGGSPRRDAPERRPDFARRRDRDTDAASRASSYGGEPAPRLRSELHFRARAGRFQGRRRARHRRGPIPKLIGIHFPKGRSFIMSAHRRGHAAYVDDHSCAAMLSLLRSWCSNTSFRERRRRSSPSQRDRRRGPFGLRAHGVETVGQSRRACRP